MSYLLTVKEMSIEDFLRKESYLEPSIMDIEHDTGSPDENISDSDWSFIVSVLLLSIFASRMRINRHLNIFISYFFNT